MMQNVLWIRQGCIHETISPKSPTSLSLVSFLIDMKYSKERNVYADKSSYMRF